MVEDWRAHGWVASVCGEAVGSATRASSSPASIIDLLHLSSGRTVVLRRVPERREVSNHDPAKEIRAEGAALALLEGQFWAPVVLASDPAGVNCGAASSVQTLIPGQAQVVTSSRWLEVLEAALRAVAGAQVDASELSAFVPWLNGELEPPPWTSRPALWLRAAEHLRGWTPTGDRLIHRDLHPGNVLIESDELGGVIDWVHACRGPIEADVSRCCVEVAIVAGAEAARELHERCGDLTTDYDPRWDLLVAAELAPWARSLLGFNAVGARLELPTIHRRLDDIVATALTQL